jgi:hypothetical protein
MGLRLSLETSLKRRLFEAKLEVKRSQAIVKRLPATVERLSVTVEMLLAIVERLSMTVEMLSATVEILSRAAFSGLVRLEICRPRIRFLRRAGRGY